MAPVLIEADYCKLISLEMSRLFTVATEFNAEKKGFCLGTEGGDSVDLSFSVRWRVGTQAAVGRANLAKLVTATRNELTIIMSNERPSDHTRTGMRKVIASFKRKLSSLLHLSRAPTSIDRNSSFDNSTKWVTGYFMHRFLFINYILFKHFVTQRAQEIWFKSTTQGRSPVITLTIVVTN